MKLVIDASVSLKWFRVWSAMETDSGRAAAILAAIAKGEATALQPPHWKAEVLAVMARKEPAEELTKLFNSFYLPCHIGIVDDANIYKKAAQLSVQLKHHLFDTMYHAAALLSDATLITADDAYFAKAYRLGKIKLLTNFALMPVSRARRREAPCNSARPFLKLERACKRKAKTMSAQRTLYDKIWDDHVVETQSDGTSLLYIDRHLVHEVTSPQAFEGLRMAHRRVRAPEKTLAVVDHNVPTTDRSHGIDDPEAALQVRTLGENCAEFGIEYFNELDHRQGVVHIIGPEQGFTLPGTTIVCGDSHTSTHGAFGALAYGIGTSEVEHVLATQTLIQKKAKNMRVTVDGALPRRRHRQGHRRWRSSARSAPRAARATSSNMPARRSARFPWKAA